MSLTTQCTRINRIRMYKTYAYPDNQKSSARNVKNITKNILNV